MRQSEVPVSDLQPTMTEHFLQQIVVNEGQAICKSNSVSSIRRKSESTIHTPRSCALFVCFSGVPYQIREHSRRDFRLATVARAGTRRHITRSRSAKTVAGRRTQVAMASERPRRRLFNAGGSGETDLPDEQHRHGQ